MHDRMVDLQRYTATPGERDFIERIKANFLGGSLSNIYNVSTIPIKNRKSTAVS